MSDTEIRPPGLYEMIQMLQELSGIRDKSEDIKATIKHLEQLIKTSITSIKAMEEPPKEPIPPQRPTFRKPPHEEEIPF